MKHEHNPAVRADARWEYCWRCRIERVLDSEIGDYHTLCPEYRVSVGEGWCPECEIVVDEAHMKRHKTIDERAEFEAFVARISRANPAGLSDEWVSAARAGWNARVSVGEPGVNLQALAADRGEGRPIRPVTSAPTSAVGEGVEGQK